MPEIWSQALSLQTAAAHHSDSSGTAVLRRQTLWPEYVELQGALDAYLREATDRIIREEVYRDADEAAERAG